MLNMNLQFFADESVNTEEVAEPTTTTIEESTESVETTVDEPVNKSISDMSMEEIIEMQKEKAEKEVEVTESEPTQTKDDNAKYAAARRESEQKLKARDEEFAKRVQGMTNPKTGEAITNQEQYFKAIDDKKELESQQAARLAQQKLQQSGVDMNIVNQLIQNSPEMQNFRRMQSQMQEVQNQQNGKEVDARVQTDLKEISKYDASIKTLEDIGNLDKAEEIVKSVQGGMSMAQAYREAYFDQIIEQRANKAKQGAINQVKAKSHLQTTKNITGGGTDVHVPESTMDLLREMYDDLSDSELRKKAARFVTT